MAPAALRGCGASRGCPEPRGGRTSGRPRPPRSGGFASVQRPAARVGPNRAAGAGWRHPLASARGCWTFGSPRRRSCCATRSRSPRRKPGG